jgi:DNA-binding transcriptional MerR regulator
VFYTSPVVTLVCVPPGPARSVSLAAAARLSGVHPELLLYYCRTGLLGPERAAQGGGHPVFDAEALEEIGRIEHYRRHLGVQRRALHLVEKLWREGERLRIELRFLKPQGGPRSGL